MAQQLFFSRDTKVFIKFGTKVWDLPVLDGFSFSQATNSSEITLAEMEGSGGSSRRGRKQFNDSLAPAEWSFATYVRPFKSAASGDGIADGAALTHAVEEVLWGMFLGGKTYADDHQLFQDSTPVEVAPAAAVVGASYVINSIGNTTQLQFNTLVGTTVVATSRVVGTSYIITGLGNTTQAQWNTLAGTSGVTYAVGATITATGAGAGDGTLGQAYAAGDAIVAAAAGGGTGTLEQVVNVPTTLSSKFNADLSNSATLGTADIFFVLGDTNRKVYKLKDCVVNEASLDFDIDGIATINWSGMSSEIIDMTSKTHTGATNPPAYDAHRDGGTVDILAGDVMLASAAGHRLSVVIDPTSSGDATMTGAIYEGTTSTTNFIRNRLTQLTVVPTTQNPTGDGSNELETSYAITLTGGNITMSNNVTFITPEEIGLVNTPIGHVTGTRSVSGSMNCYLSKDTTATNNSADLWEDLKSISSVVTNSFALDFKIGGTATGIPRLQVSMPTCHLEIPTHSIEDVISVETSFNALPSTIDGTNEATITYFSKQ